MKPIFTIDYQEKNKAMKQNNTSQKKFDIFLAVITWIAMVLQVINANNLINTFSYFTIISNLLIAISLTIQLVSSGSRGGKICTNISVQSALTVYIIIVALIYNFVIRRVWIEAFPQFYYNNIFHVLTPLLYVIRWVIFVPKGDLNWGHGFKWLIFPFLYLFYSLIRGNIVNWYPYGFVDLRVISTSELIRNVILVLFLFMLIGFGLVFADKRIGKVVRSIG